jgi:PHD/YefM family antitoxin component YafN of YafNO toxin-antitoxin module
MALRLFAGALCVFVVAIHVVDQGGLTALADPPYKGYLFYALEIGGASAAILLLTRRTAAAVGWVLALGVSLGPACGYILSRSTGLPAYADDIGNWFEPLGVASLVVEGLLFVCALTALIADHRMFAAELRTISGNATPPPQPPPAQRGASPSVLAPTVRSSVAPTVTEIRGFMTMDVTDACDHMAAAIDAAQTDTVVLQRRGRPSAVMIPSARYDELMSVLARLTSSEAAREQRSCENWR